MESLNEGMLDQASSSKWGSMRRFIVTTTVVILANISIYLGIIAYHTSTFFTDSSIDWNRISHIPFDGHPSSAVMLIVVWISSVLLLIVANTRLAHSRIRNSIGYAIPLLMVLLLPIVYWLDIVNGEKNMAQGIPTGLAAIVAIAGLTTIVLFKSFFGRIPSRKLISGLIVGLIIIPFLFSGYIFYTVQSAVKDNVQVGLINVSELSLNDAVIHCATKVKINVDSCWDEVFQANPGVDVCDRVSEVVSDPDFIITYNCKQFRYTFLGAHGEIDCGKTLSQAGNGGLENGTDALSACWLQQAELNPGIHICQVLHENRYRYKNAGSVESCLAATKEYYTIHTNY